MVVVTGGGDTSDGENGCHGGDGGNWSVMVGMLVKVGWRRRCW